MKRVFVILIAVILLIFAGCSAENGIDIENDGGNVIENENKPIVIVAYGDSLTEGFGIPRTDAYPAQLESRLNEKGYNVKVYNSGYSGETTTGALDRLNWVLQLNPDIVIFTTGANDAFRGISPEIIEQNMRDVIERLLEEDIIVVLGGMEIVQNLGETYINQFESIYPRLAEEYDIYYIPFLLEGVAGNSSLNLPDEIHPTKEGYSIIVENNILPVIEEILQNKS